MSETMKVVLAIVGVFFVLKLLGGSGGSLFGTPVANPNLVAQLNAQTNQQYATDASGVIQTILNDYAG